MSKWLFQEETPFDQSLLVSGAARVTRSIETYSILLRTVRILDNRRLFFASDIIVYTVTVDGYPDMKSEKPFWTQQFNFSDVKDGATLSIDTNTGVLMYRGWPRGFLNLYLLVIRDTKSTQSFTKILQDNFVAQGLGTLAGAAVSIYADLPPTVTVPMTRDLTTKAVETTLDYFSNQQNLAIGTYYASLIKEKKYGVGLHPPNYPTAFISCGGALEIAYEVSKE